jgi:predicted HTH transcriptional regulator
LDAIAEFIYLYNIADRLEDWTYERIKELVDNNVYESEIHDYKGNIPDTATLTEVCCSFANSPKGGFVILGIDKKFRIVGIENTTELPHEVRKKLRAIPTINPPLPKVIHIPGSTKILAVFHIPFSTEGPHVPVDEQKDYFGKELTRVRNT